MNRYLRYGCKPGPDVEAWEWFLRGHRDCSEIVVDHEFDQQTRQETKIFQAAHGLKADGVVGPATLGVALKAGFNPLESENDTDRSGPNWPPAPAGMSQLSYAQRLEVFGQFKFRPAPSRGNPEAIKILDDWASKNIKKITVPQLQGVTGAPKNGTIFFHRKASDQLLAMFQKWEDENLSDRILGWAGSWVPRYIRGSRSVLSNHAWATAFDINVPWNYMGAMPALVGKRGCVRELVQIANEHGFYWGGHFKRRPDGMHFEIVNI